MTVARTARRRRRQFQIGFRHLAKLGRPIYSNKSVESQARRLREVMAKESLMAHRKGAKSKSKKG